MHLCYPAETCSKSEFYLQANRTRAKISKAIDAGRILLPSVGYASGDHTFSMAATKDDHKVDAFYNGHLAGVFVPLLEV